MKQLLCDLYISPGEVYNLSEQQKPLVRKKRGNEVVQIGAATARTDFTIEWFSRNSRQRAAIGESPQFGCLAL